MAKRTYTETQLAKLHEIESDEMCVRLSYFSHDSDARRDPKIRNLMADAGDEAMAAYGRWWVLCECLAEAEGHRYDVRTERGWAFLALDMSMDVDECRDFVRELGVCGLVDPDMLSSGYVTSERMLENAETYARTTAKRRLAAMITNGLE